MKNRLLSIQQDLRGHTHAQSVSISFNKNIKKKNTDHTMDLPVIGVVTNQGNPVPNATVRIVDFRSAEGNISYTPVKSSTKTDSKGQFFLELNWSGTSLGEVVSPAHVLIEIDHGDSTYEVRMTARKQHVIVSIIKELTPKFKKSHEHIVDKLHDFAGLKRGLFKGPSKPSPEYVHMITFDQIELSDYQ